ncbi:carbonic anhydrase [Nonomuraea sp. PA05]|uniref:carbonic anhydrase n=1 Tax=Nonomuraea sp. PA05 TaxID=2604466 RepID=UPI0011D7647D|nr:carbonic anhydrase [Nonomuraea sp. PA05]TYB70340.1 carbonic anhydrase [Nonomuraea sp. PA05]
MWSLLEQGNRRWAAGKSAHPHQDPRRRRQVASGQQPRAVVLSCIDSRVPPEVVFDVGLGDLLVVRTAAHTLDSLVTAAVQYGPQDLRASLVVVLGHQRCGAVTAAARALRRRLTLPGELPAIVEALEPAYTTSNGRVEPMVHAHIQRTVTCLRADSLLYGSATVIGAYYSLDTGLVSRVI